MKFWERSLVLRSIFSLLLGFVLAGLFWKFAPAQWLNFWYVLTGLLVYFAVVIYLQIVRPFQVIITQIRALLTGRKYKKIYSKRTDEVGIIAHFFNQVTDTFEAVSSEIREGKKVTGELKLAGQLQRELLPLQMPKMKGLDIVIKNRPAEELGGDNFDFIVVNDELYLYLGDVTGHGIPAAIVMTMVNTLIHAFVDMYKTAFEIVVATNKRLKMRIRSTFFMSMVMLKWNSTTRKMTFVGCGHEYILIYRPGKGVCEAIVSGGIALGMIPDNSKIIKELELQVQTGDVIVLYTDGITEARNMAGEMYGLPRLQKAVEQYAALYDSEGIVGHIAKDFSAFVEEHVQEDDVTLMAITILDDAAPVKAEQKISWNSEAPINYTFGELDEKKPVEAVAATVAPVAEEKVKTEIAEPVAEIVVPAKVETETLLEKAEVAADSLAKNEVPQAASAAPVLAPAAVTTAGVKEKVE